MATAYQNYLIGDDSSSDSSTESNVSTYSEDDTSERAIVNNVPKGKGRTKNYGKAPRSVAQPVRTKDSSSSLSEHTVLDQRLKDYYYDGLNCNKDTQFLVGPIIYNKRNDRHYIGHPNNKNKTTKTNIYLETTTRKQKDSN